MRFRARVALAAAVATAAAGAPAGAVPTDRRTPAAVSSRSGTPLADCTADSVGTQLGIVHPGSEVEAHVAVSPADPAETAVAWQQDRWSNGGARGVLTAVSADTGKTWTQVVETKTSECTGGTAANGGGYQRATDPWLAYGADGTLFLMTLSIDQAPGTPFGADPDAMLVVRSQDGGMSWSDPAALIRDEDPDVLNDKNSITADPVDPDRVYAVWTRIELVGGSAPGPAWFTRTTDGGDTWEPARPIFDPGLAGRTTGNQIAVLPGGRLVNLFTLVSDGALSVAAVASDDFGVTWSDANTVASHQSVETVDPLTGETVRSGRFLPDIAVDPGSGDLYAVWSDARFSGGTHNSVALSMSADGGVTWTEPVRVDQTPERGGARDRQAFTPAVEVAADGTVGVTYFDFRRNDTDGSTDDPLETDHFLVHCHDTDSAAASACADASGWSEERLTRRPFDLRRAPRANGIFIGDYVGLAASTNAFSALTVRSRAGDPATVFHSLVRPAHEVEVSLRLRRHLVARGRAAAAAAAPRACTDRVRVKIQRRRPGGWKVIARTRTTAEGRYRKRLPDRAGRYRARVARRTLTSGDLCASAWSPVRRHRH